MNDLLVSPSVVCEIEAIWRIVLDPQQTFACCGGVTCGCDVGLFVNDQTGWVNQAGDVEFPVNGQGVRSPCRAIGQLNATAGSVGGWTDGAAHHDLLPVRAVIDEHGGFSRNHA